MNLAQSIVLRDCSIKNSILTLFSESEQKFVREKIDAGFKAGNSTWEEKHLPTALGAAGAEKVKQT